MSRPKSVVAINEPLGIVISCGTRTEPIPVWSAYVWSEVPAALERVAVRSDDPEPRAA